MQPADVAKKCFRAARGRRKQRAAVRIDVTLLTRRECHSDCFVLLANDTQSSDVLLRLAQLNAGNQLSRRQRRSAVGLDLSAIARERRNDLLLVREQCTGHTDDAQYHADRDADDPVQLEESLAWRHQTSAQLRSRL